MQAKISRDFHRPEGIYALAHSVGPLCKPAELALQEHYLSNWERAGGDAWPAWLGQVEEFRTAISHLLNVEQRGVCPQASVSIGFSQWLAACAKNRAKSKRYKVILHEEAFASLGFAVSGLCATYDLSLELVNYDANDLDEWDKVLSKEDVFAALITHAHSNTGQLSRVNSIAEIAKQHNVLCAVDIAQSVGIIPIDASTWQVDCIVGSCVKWLSGGPGAGFIYIPENQLHELEPDHVAWFSHASPFEFDIRHYKPADSALRFWGGTPAIAPFCMAAASINTIINTGVSVLRKHNLQLMQPLIANYEARLPKHYHTGDYTGTLCLPIDCVKKEKLESLLAKQQIKYDSRDLVLRLSFCAINTTDDVTCIDDILKACMP